MIVNRQNSTKLEVIFKIPRALHLLFQLVVPPADQITIYGCVAAGGLAIMLVILLAILCCCKCKKVKEGQL